MRAVVIALVLVGTVFGMLPDVARAKESPDTPTPASLAVLKPPLPRPAVLPALYGGLVGLQVLDAYTTAAAINRGAVEVNPALHSGNQARVWAVRAATAATTIYFVERLWKKNRVAAVLLMAGINGGYTAVAAHNARQGRR